MRQRPSDAAAYSCPWQIHSVPLKASDGPERLAQVYQLLLQPRPFPHQEPTASRPSRLSVHREFGPWETVYYRFQRWKREGLWEQIRHILLTADYLSL
jgi:hypothetical protein